MKQVQDLLGLFGHFLNFGNLRMTNLTRFFAALGLVSLVGGAQATLSDRGGGMIYDSDLDITWLQNWNQGAGSGYDDTVGLVGTGRMTWDNARAWADNLVWGGYSDWRLPTMEAGGLICDFSNAGGTNCGYNVLTKMTKGGSTVYNEMAHLWHETLGNLAYCAVGDEACDSPQPGWGLKNRGPFTNMQPYGYWSGTVEDGDLRSPSAWLFWIDDGYQNNPQKSNALFAVAVRAGDVTSAVPEPQVYSMLLVGLGALSIALRRRPD